MIIFNDLHETRPPKKGEWYHYEPNAFLQASCDYHTKYPIYERIEIVEPAGATQSLIRFGINGIWPSTDEWKIIELPRPKVKKYQWQLNLSGVWVTTREYLANAPNVYNDRGWSKIADSEIEVEE